MLFRSGIIIILSIVICVDYAVICDRMDTRFVVSSEIKGFAHFIIILFAANSFFVFAYSWAKDKPFRLTALILVLIFAYVWFMGKIFTSFFDKLSLSAPGFSASLRGKVISMYGENSLIHIMGIKGGLPDLYTKFDAVYWWLVPISIVWIIAYFKFRERNMK